MTRYSLFSLFLSLSDSFIVFSFLYPKEILKLMKSFYICLKYSEDSLKKKSWKNIFFLKMLVKFRWNPKNAKYWIRIPTITSDFLKMSWWSLKNPENPPESWNIPKQSRESFNFFLLGIQWNTLNLKNRWLCQRNLVAVQRILTNLNQTPKNPKLMILLWLSYYCLR